MNKDEPELFELMEVYSPPESKDQAEAERREFLMYFYSEYLNEDYSESSSGIAQQEFLEKFENLSEYCGESCESRLEEEEWGLRESEDEESLEEELSEEEETSYVGGTSDESDEETLERQGILNSSGWLKLSTDKYPWSEDLFPYTSPLKYEKMSLNNEERGGKLTVGIMATGLSNLCLVPGNIFYALTKLQLPNKNLHDISILSQYEYLQYIDISFNQVTDLSSLSGVSYLMVLDASNNLLSSIEGYAPPWYLTYLNLSWNLFTAMPDLSSFWSLRHVDISHNKIKAISGLSDLKFLSYLNMSHNEITTIVQLGHLPLKELNLSHNGISICEEGQLRRMHGLREIDVSFNKLKSLKMIRWNYQLDRINVSFNKISNIAELDWLSNLRRSTELWIEGNPVAMIQQIRQLIIYLMPRLACLDSSPVLPNERINAVSLYSDNVILSAFRRIGLDKVMMGGTSSPLQRLEHNVRLYNPAIVVVVGLPGSYRVPLVCNVATNYPRYIKLGKVHATRFEGSIADNNLGISRQIFTNVSPDEFSKMKKEGKFAVIETMLGFTFGIKLEEMEFEGRVCLIQMELDTVLELMWMGFNPVLVLAMPTDVLVHVSRLISLFYDNLSFAHSEKESEAPAVVAELSHDASKRKSRPEKQSLMKRLSPFYECEKTGSPVRGEDVLSQDKDELVNRANPEITSLLNFFPKNYSEMNFGSRTGSLNWDEERERFHLTRYPTRAFSHSEFGFHKREVGSESGSCICLKEKSPEPSVRTPSLTEEEQKRLQEEAMIQRRNQKSAEYFIKSVLHHREQYISAHINNPGLFLQAVATDDLDEATSKVAKICLEVYNTIGKDEVNILDRFRNDNCYSEIVGQRIYAMMMELKKNQSSAEQYTLDIISAPNKTEDDT